MSLIQNSNDNQIFAYKEQEYYDYDFSEHEANVMKSLKHENIVQVFDYGTINENPLKHWYTMEYTSLGSLRGLIGVKHDIIASCDLALKILDGLKYIHDNSFVHRDLKPENILLFDNSNLKISDFGLAKKIDEFTRSVISFKGGGTQAYMAPELFEFKRASIKSDIYAFGVLFFELLSGGELPYKKNIADWFRIHDAPTRIDIAEFRQDVDWQKNWRLSKILKKLNYSHINLRYNSCEEVIADIQKLSHHLTQLFLKHY